ncbi:hypothetical protein MXB_5162, partial [Myxobolus squamalis]
PKISQNDKKIIFSQTSLDKSINQIEITIFRIICSYSFIHRVNCGLDEFDDFYIDLLSVCPFLKRGFSETRSIDESVCSFEFDISVSDVLKRYIELGSQFSSVNFVLNEMYQDFLIIIESQHDNIPHIFYCLFDIYKTLKKYAKVCKDAIYVYKKIKLFIHWLTGNFLNFASLVTPFAISRLEYYREES